MVDQLGLWHDGWACSIQNDHVCLQSSWHFPNQRQSFTTWKHSAPSCIVRTPPKSFTEFVGPRNAQARHDCFGYGLGLSAQRCHKANSRHDGSVRRKNPSATTLDPILEMFWRHRSRRTRMPSKQVQQHYVRPKKSQNIMAPRMEVSCCSQLDFDVWLLCPFFADLDDWQNAKHHRPLDGCNTSGRHGGCPSKLD